MKKIKRDANAHRKNIYNLYKQPFAQGFLGSFNENPCSFSINSFLIKLKEK